MHQINQKNNDKFEYEFDIKKMDNAIREIRWDPGENANVTINDVVGNSYV